MAKEKNQIFVRVSPELKDAWDEMCRKRNIAQNLAATRLVQWIVAQDQELQLLVMNSMDPAEDLVEMILDRLRERRGVRMKIAGKPK